VNTAPLGSGIGDHFRFVQLITRHNIFKKTVKLSYEITKEIIFTLWGTYDIWLRKFNAKKRTVNSHCGKHAKRKCVRLFCVYALI